MDEDDYENYLNGPTRESFFDLTKTFYNVMNFRKSRNANIHKITKKGRILREIKQFQFIQFDIQNCLISNERRQIQKEALHAAQELSYLSDPQEVQKMQTKQLNNYSQQRSQEIDSFSTNSWDTTNYANDDEEEDIYKSQGKIHFNLGFKPKTGFNNDQNDNDSNNSNISFNGLNNNNSNNGTRSFFFRKTRR